MGSGESGRPTGIGPRDVLVVEDDVSITKLMGILLERGGYRVRQAETFAKAKTSIQDSEPALIILDIGLPDGSGLEILRWLRADLGKSTPVVVVSAYGQEAKVAQAYELGANDFVSKPFRPNELLARIQRVLEG